jgi:hypothetical protein
MSILELSDPVNTPGQSTPNPKPGHHIEDEEYAVGTTTSHPATATETVRKAIETAEKNLSSRMREAARHAAKNHEGRWVVVGRRDTLAALASRGMVAGYLSRRVAELNDFGRVVHVVIVKGADAVLAWAEQKDAERADYAEGHRVGAAFGDAAVARGAGSAARLGKELEETSSAWDWAWARGKRDALMDALHTLALAEDEQRERGRQEAAKFIAEYGARDAAELSMGDTIDTPGRDLPLVQAYRSVIMDELHTRAIAEHAARLDPLAPDAVARCTDTECIPSGRAHLCDTHGSAVNADTRPSAIDEPDAAPVKAPVPICTPRRGRAKSGSTFDMGREPGYPWPLEYAPRWTTDHHPWRIVTAPDAHRFSQHEVEEQPGDAPMRQQPMQQHQAADEQPNAVDTTTANATNSPTGAARTYSRDECLLGPVHGVVLPDEETEQGVTRTSYELNIIDGWVRVHEWTDESGVVWTGESTTQSRVRDVVDAAPEHADFVAKVHLAWVKAMAEAGQSQQARTQRRALTRALQRHGLTLTKAPRRPATPPRQADHATLF